MKILLKNVRFAKLKMQNYPVPVHRTGTAVMRIYQLAKKLCNVWTSIILLKAQWNSTGLTRIQVGNNITQKVSENGVVSNITFCVIFVAF